MHLVPALGARHLDAITTEDVQRLKRALENRSPKTVNNVLTVLNTLLKQAVAWDVIETVPCTIRLLKAPRAEAQFHDFEAFQATGRGRRSSRPDDPPARAAGWGSWPSLWRDDGAGVARRGSRPAAAVRGSVGLEGSGDRHQRGKGSATLP